MPETHRWRNAEYSIATSMSRTDLLSPSCTGIAASSSERPTSPMAALLAKWKTGTRPKGLGMTEACAPEVVVIDVDAGEGACVPCRKLVASGRVIWDSELEIYFSIRSG